MTTIMRTRPEDPAIFSCCREGKKRGKGGEKRGKKKEKKRKKEGEGGEEREETNN